MDWGFPQSFANRTSQCLRFTKHISRLARVILAIVLIDSTRGCKPASAAELPVPKISEVTRVDRDTRPKPADIQTSTFILKTSPHPTLGEAYVIITDHTNDTYLKALEKLAKFHHGTVVQAPSLANFYLFSTKAEKEQLQAKLRELKPRYVAIAPRPESYSDNLLPGVWKVLTELDDKSQLPVFPGLLVAPDSTAFEALVDRSIQYKPQPVAQLHPFAIGQVIGPMPPGQRSLQKVRMMRNLFGDYGCLTPSLVIRAYTAIQMQTTVAPAPNEWQVDMPGAGDFVKTIPAPAKQALDDSSLLIMYGHGTPGMACSLDVSVFDDVKMANKVVLCGACYSAPATSSRQILDNSFAMRAVQNGAVVVFAHMRENAGFPHMFPVLENWTDGLTVGEAYQRLMNALMAGESEPGNDELLYVIIGDPALQPLEKMKPIKP